MPTSFFNKKLLNREYIRNIFNKRKSENLTAHNSAGENDFAKTVIMPGDPARAEMIAKKYLENPRLVTNVRGICGYTGMYKGKLVSVMAHGMGMPSMGIYCYELYKFFRVENIIRVGSCGSFSEDYKVRDVVLVENSYTEANFAFALTGKKKHIEQSDETINEKIMESSSELNIECKKVNVVCAEVFDWYVKDFSKYLKRLPKKLHIMCTEMESFALFYTAKYLGKRASCLLTVVDSHVSKEHVDAEAREKSLNDMIELALETATKL